uniref:LIM zinc-binding domain-containing protein n=1 Tax=Pygocentrus nattereri TaxID=42514 RepID=A0A3B4C546_PYGNA
MSERKTKEKKTVRKREREKTETKKDGKKEKTKVSSLGKNWHRFCLKCERCNKILSPGGHAEHDGLPYCHKPCYGTLFGPKGVNIGGAGSYIYDTPPQTPVNKSCDSPSDSSPTTVICHCHVTVMSYVFGTAEKVTSLGRNWHRPCLRCERCKKTLASGGHAEHEGRPYCHVPCYGYLFGPKGVNIGKVGCYVYDKDNTENEIPSEY